MEGHQERADALDEDVKRLEHEATKVGEDIDEARSDWAAKQESSEVPGAVAEREESDQRPEEAPAEQVPDDAGGDTREEAEENPGVPGEEERGTGNQPDEQEGDA
jgi:hypothetical protein